MDVQFQVNNLLESGLRRVSILGATGSIGRSTAQVIREAPGRFLFSATVELLEEYGFTRGRQVGKHAWIMSRVVEPA